MNPSLSQTPFLIRALWEWCTEAGLSPQIVVVVDESTRVPMQFVEDGRIVLDISAEATNQLQLGNEWITFQARFGTRVEDIDVPVDNVVAIFAEETNQGMMFEMPSPPAEAKSTLSSSNEHAGAHDPERGMPAQNQTEPHSGPTDVPAQSTKPSPLRVVK